MYRTRPRSKRPQYIILLQPAFNPQLLFADSVPLDLRSSVVVPGSPHPDSRAFFVVVPLWIVPGLVPLHPVRIADRRPAALGLVNLQASSTFVRSFFSSSSIWTAFPSAYLKRSHSHSLASAYFGLHPPASAAAFC